MANRSLLNKEIHNQPICGSDREWHLTRPHGEYTRLSFFHELRQVVRACRLEEKRSLLIVGGGCGVEAAYFRKRLPELQVVNSDISQQFCTLSLALQERRGVRFPSVAVNAESIPFKDRSFEVVLCNGAFHHMERQDAVVREMCRVAQKVVAFASEPVLSASRRFARLIDKEGVEYDGFRPYAPSIPHLRKVFRERDFVPLYYSGHFNTTVFPRRLSARLDTVRGKYVLFGLLQALNALAGHWGPSAVMAFRRARWDPGGGPSTKSEVRANG